MRRTLTAGVIGLVAAGLLGASGGEAWARNRCVAAAKQDLVGCRADCREGFQLAKDMCLDRDHDCVEVCRARREACVEATGLDAARAACDATLRAARQRCREDHPAGSTERDQCIDQAQVVAFQCRDDAREAARPGLRRCRRAFRRCARGCGQNVPADRTAVRACRDSAKAEHQACRARCREDVQIDRDACRNRDHACAEACRADRDACRDPIDAARDTDVATCAATRDTAVENCRNLFAADTPERDTCIDDAQVDAFRCRDQARETARPGLDACRDTFRGCIQGCPPAS